jgi:hypothetical protein
MTVLTGSWRWLGTRTRRATVLWGLVLAVLLEVVTCLLRFGLQLQSTRDTRVMGVCTFGYRIHHAYTGVLLLLVALLISRGSWRTLCVVLGIGLVLSDLAHHFAVLWPITGDPQFHLRYADLAAGAAQP